jgi:hypothetical protein
MASVFKDGIMLDQWKAQELDDATRRGDLFKGFVGPTSPVSPVEGDLWITNFNTPIQARRYTNGSWVSSAYTPILNDQFDSTNSVARYTLTSQGWVSKATREELELVDQEVALTQQAVSTLRQNQTALEEQVLRLADTLLNFDELDPVFAAWLVSALDDTGKLKPEMIPTLPAGFEFVELLVNDMPDFDGELGKIYVQPDGIMWGWDGEKYLQINGMTNISHLATKESLNNHIDSDQTRWQVEADAKLQMTADIKAWTKSELDGINPPYDYTQPIQVIGKEGLLDISLSTSSYTFPMDGTIVCAASGFLSVTTRVLVDDDEVWDAPLLLGISGSPNPSDEIPVVAGQVLRLSSVLAVGAAISVTFYPVGVPAGGAAMAIKPYQAGILYSIPDQVLYSGSMMYKVGIVPFTSISLDDDLNNGNLVILQASVPQRVPNWNYTPWIAKTGTLVPTKGVFQNVYLVDGTASGPDVRTYGWYRIVAWSPEYSATTFSNDAITAHIIIKVGSCEVAVGRVGHHSQCIAERIVYIRDNPTQISIIVEQDNTALTGTFGYRIERYTQM